MTEIKKVIQKIYEFDFSHCEVADGEELVITDKGNEFINTLVKRDLDKGIIITPAGYKQGLIYKSANNGELYNNPQWYPEIVDFSLNLYGLKKNAFYRVTVTGRNTRKYNSVVDVSDNRELIVSNDSQELLLREDFSNVMSNKDVSGIFRATTVEMNLNFKLGKIVLNNIVIEEVEIQKDKEELPQDKKDDFELNTGKSTVVAYGVFSNDWEERGKFCEFIKITGKGLNLYYDKTTNEYILERDNYEDTIGLPFTGANYIIDFVFTKAPYASYEITDVSADVSPNTLKQGYIRFKVTDTNSKTTGRYARLNGRLSFVVNKIN